MPDRVGLSVDRLDQELAAWKRSFGGGMIEFDRAWFDAQRRDEGTPADHVREGAHALLDAFVARLKQAADDTRRGEATNREAQAPLPASVSATPEGSQGSTGSVG